MGQPLDIVIVIDKALCAPQVGGPRVDSADQAKHQDGNGQPSQDGGEARETEERGIALLRTRLVSSVFIERISRFLEDKLAPTGMVHGVLMEIMGVHRRLGAGD